MSRRVPNGPGRRPYPVKRRKPRGLGKGYVHASTLRQTSVPLTPAEPMTPAERAHHAASMNRRLPLS